MMMMMMMMMMIVIIITLTQLLHYSQLTFTYSKSPIETLEKGVKCV